MIAYIENDMIDLPDQQVMETHPYHIYIPLRGYGYVMGVCDVSSEPKLIGWITSERLGFSSVKEWLANNNSFIPTKEWMNDVE